MITPEFAAALQRVEAQRAKKEEKPPEPKRRLIRRSVLATNGMEEVSVHALRMLGATHMLRQTK
jgi:hypothetical protein